MDQNGHLLKEIKANPPLHKTIKLDSEWIPTGLVGSSMDFSQPLFTCPVWPQLLVAKFAWKVAFHISGCGEGRYTSMLSDDSMIIYLCMRLYVQLCHCSSSWRHRPLDWTWNIARNTTPAASIYIYIYIYITSFARPFIFFINVPPYTGTFLANWGISQGISTILSSHPSTFLDATSMKKWTPRTPEWARAII